MTDIEGLVCDEKIFAVTDRVLVNLVNLSNVNKSRFIVCSRKIKFYFQHEWHN